MNSVLIGQNDDLAAAGQQIGKTFAKNGPNAVIVFGCGLKGGRTLNGQPLLTITKAEGPVVSDIDNQSPMDVDHFKKINDQYGHFAGDKVLIGMARILEKTTRKSDIVGRWGEEFLIICPQTDLKGGRALAELLRRHISEHKFETLHATVSLGVSEFETGVSAEETVKRADQLLYKAKGQGRNKVC